MARGDEEDQGTHGSVTSETGWKSITLLLLNKHMIVISGGPWSPKSLMDMEPVIDSLIELHACSWPAVTLTLKVLAVTIYAQWEGMGDVGSARYELALLPPCPTVRVLSYSN